jgi:hypothetical protein
MLELPMKNSTASGDVAGQAPPDLVNRSFIADPTSFHIAGQRTLPYQRSGPLKSISPDVAVAPLRTLALVQGKS